MAKIDLHEKVVIVTGASDGIGAMTAREFVNAGARVVLAARSEKALQRLAEELGASRALAVYTDMTDVVSVERMIERAINHLGQVDILVNNAGVGYLSTVSEVAIDKAYHVFDVNFLDRSPRFKNSCHIGASAAMVTSSTFSHARDVCRYRIKRFMAPAKPHSSFSRIRSASN